jgi:molybdopterin-dependent oxidoreductase alpha subunit
MSIRKISETPPDSRTLKIKKPKNQAAGIPAVVSSFNHSIRKMGVTRTVKTLGLVNQKEGFDCPGCAWPDPEHRSSFEFCENGAKAVADEAMTRTLGPDFFKTHSVSQLLSWSDYELNASGRLSHPMILKEGSDHYEKISWNEAIEMISNRLNELDNPNRAVFYTSGRTSNEAAFLYQAFVRKFGTNNLPDCSNMCHESSGKALSSTIGIGKGTVTLDDFDHADLILVIGQNPGTNHPRMLSALESAKKNGAKIVSINPLPEAGLQRFKHPQDYMKANFVSTQLADMFVPVKIGGDAALLQAISKIIISKNAHDEKFIENNCLDFEAFKSSLSEVDLENLSLQAGISLAQIQSLASLCIASKSTISCWAMGLTQHRNGVQVIQEVVNLMLLGGHIGKKGAGLCPVRGHSNVQGDRTMGIWEAPPEAFLERLEESLGFEVPRQHGYDVVNSIHAMENGDVDFFFCMGGNFLSASPETRRTGEAIQNVDFTVQVSTKLNRSHLITGKTALILPCLGRTEIDIQKGQPQFVTVENSMGIVHMSKGSLNPISDQLKSEVSIICSIGAKTFPNDDFDWENFANDYDKIRDLIENSIHGFERYNERVRKASGFSLPNPPRDSLTFSTSSGKAHFSSNPLPRLEVEPGRYVMMTIRSHDQYNTTIYGLQDRYRGIGGNRRVILMNAEDMAQRGWKSRQLVDITSHYGSSTIESKRWSIVAYPIPRGNLASYFPEANVLVPLESTADISNTPTSKWIECSLKAHKE